MGHTQYSSPGPDQRTAAVASAEEGRLRSAEDPSRNGHEVSGWPLSSAQQRLWFLEQLEPGTPLYNIPTVARLKGQLNVAALEQSIKAMLARHEALRTRIIGRDEQPLQIVDESPNLEWRLVELTQTDKTEREAEAERLTREEINRPFNLSSDRLVRVTLLRLTADTHLLIVVMHHIIADDWSVNILFQELAKVYSAIVEARPVALPELPIQYADYAVWQQEQLQGEELTTQLGFWREQLKGSPPMLEFPTDAPRGAATGFEGHTQTRRISKGLSQDLKRLAKQEDSTLFMLLLAAFKALAYRYTGQGDMVVASPMAGRSSIETEGLVGFFVNTLPIRTDLSDDPKFQELLGQVRRVMLAAYAHQDVPLEKLVEELRPERSSSHLPFTRVMFVFQSSVLERIELPGVSMEFLEADTDTSKFDVTFGVQETSQGLVFRVEYNIALFEAATMTRLLEHFEVLLKGIATDPNRRISELPLLTEAERHQLLVEWNNTTTDYPRNKCVHELFEQQARRTPDAIAVVYGRRSLTYRELNERANQLARYLKRCKVGPDVPVGICVERSPEMVVGLLGILKAGGAYVPLDSGYPGDRLGFMLNDVQARVVLTQQALRERLPGELAKVICLDSDWTLVEHEASENLDTEATPENLAYIMYTSGSTGRPKGVAVPHRAVNRLVLNTNYIHLGASDRVAQISNVSFDAATFELWGALLNGAALVGIPNEIVLSPKDFAEALKEARISAIFLTAALFNQLAASAPTALETVRTVIAGGEALSPKWVREVLRQGAPERFLNGYGPTENTTFTCCHEVEGLAEAATNVPIGRPISNTEVYILDAHQNLVPVGVPGELYIGGDGLARGYWNRPELTAEKFVKNPFRPNESDLQLYRTGDIARYLPDGAIEFLGRLDDQVKIRGFRIELGEIEATLRHHPEVKDCVVKVYGHSAEQKRLAAYFVPSGGCAPGADELRRFLSKTLPEYMLPATFVQVEGLALTPNGKIDRKSLPEPDDARPKLEKRYAAPRDEVERQLTTIWEDVLGVHPVGIQDTFFDLGGHSLLAIRLIARIEKAFKKKLRLATIFQAPTVEGLAAIVREEMKETGVTSSTSVVEIQPKGSRPPLFLVHGAGGGMFWGYTNLSRHLGPEQPLYAFRSRGLEGRKEFERLEDMAAEYVNDLRKIQPSGPYYLGGYCFGGNVAFEMARQLEAKGETVALLALLNCSAPNSRYTQIPLTPRWGLAFLKNLWYWGQYFKGWTPAQRREFFRWKSGRMKNRIEGFWNGSGRSSALDVGEMVDLSAFSAEERVLWEAHIRALLNYHPQPYRGQVHLFRSPGHPIWCSFDEDYGWNDLAQGGVQVTSVPAVHEKILEEPCVERVARELERLLINSKPVPGPTAERNGHERTRSPDARELRRQVFEEISSLGESLAYWKQQLAGAPALLELPTDYPRPAARGCRAGFEKRTLPGKLREGLRSLSQRFDTDESTILLGALAVLLQRYTRQEEMIVGVHVPTRDEQASSQQNRETANFLPIRIALNGEPNFRQLMEQLSKVLATARSHPVRFDRLIEEIRPAQDLSYHPLYQIIFNARDSANARTGMELQERTTNLDLSFQVTESDGKMTLGIEYAKDLFEPVTIERMLGHWETVLESIETHPKEPLCRLPILGREEERLLLEVWTDTRKEYPKEKTLVGLFEEQVARAPSAEALICGKTRLTYGELYARSKIISRRLQSMGVGRETLVGICLDRSWEMVAAILGTLQAGGAYVPMDPAYPKDRLAFMLEDAKVHVLLTQKEVLAALPETKSLVLCVEELDWQAAETRDESSFTIPKASDLAYVIYTSGSTGKPKGVALEHRNAVALVCWAREVFSSEELSGVLASTSICFDLSVFEMFVPLSWGGKVIVAENALALPGLAAAKEVRMINTVPSAIRQLLRIKGVPESVQVVNLAGEPLATSLVDQIHGETAVEKVYDLYGPTETTTYSTFTRRNPGERATIGRPLANEQVYILDSNRQLVPIGVPGELYIGGDGLARGYLNRPELTAEKFVEHPFTPGRRLYRTGDLARWRADGNLEYLGRMDYQVKIRGFRIELGEIEAVLRKATGVREAVVMAREDEPGEKRLAAYIVAKAGETLTAEKLRNALKEKLPEYMTPSAFVFLDTLPLTPNGKVDRKALPAPSTDRGGSSADFVAPRNVAEEQIAGIWREVLRLKEIGVRDKFFDVGGDSLLGIQVISRVREMFAVELPLFSLFDAPTIEALAQGIASGRWDREREPIPSLHPVSRDGHLPLSFVQERLWFLDQLQPGGHAYNVPAAVRLRGKLDLDALQKALEKIVSRHEALRTTFKYAEEELTQRITREGPVTVKVMDLRDVPPETREKRAQEMANAEAQRPFDLERGPLLRTSVLQLDKDDNVFLLVMHHTISDGWSLGIFYRELEALYGFYSKGKSAHELPDLTVQYADFACWKREWMQGAALQRELKYWKEKLAGAPPALELPVEHDRGTLPSLKAKRCSVQFPEALSKAVGEFSQRHGCTPFIVILGALGLALQKWTAQPDMVIGTVVAGRNRREIENVIGCFMNFLPLRLTLSPEQTGEEMLAAVRATVLEGQSHEDCPFEKMVEAINPERRLNQNPLYNVGLLFQNFPIEVFRGESLQSESFPIAMEEALLDLRFEAEQTEDRLSLSCEYKTALFESGAIERLLAFYQEGLEALLARPEQRLRDFPALPAANAGNEVVSRQPDQTIAITSTFTAEPVAESLDYWMKDLGVQAEIEFAPYNQVFQQLLDPASLFGRNQSGLNVILLRLEDWERSANPGAAGNGREEVERNAAEFVAALRSAAGRGSIPHLVCLCPSSSRVTNEDGQAEFYHGMEKSLASELEAVPGVYLLTMADLSRWYPVEDYYDASGDELGHVPYTPVFFTALGTAVARKFHALKKPAYKVIVLDCDNTLWSGVCGEDGPKGVRLDAPYVTLQKFMRAQHETGMLLCVCSKNNEPDVHEVFAQRLEMPLRAEHFTAWRINWRPKSENLKSLARELGLGLESFILVDDNPVECAEVEARCPGVLTLHLPEEPGRIAGFLEHCWIFDHLKLTTEDRRRTEMYRQNQQREQLRAHSPSLADFLTGLDLKTDRAVDGRPVTARSSINAADQPV